MRILGVAVVLLLLGSCASDSGDDAPEAAATTTTSEAATTTTQAATTTTTSPCLRVSKVFEANIDLTPASSLGAVKRGSKWLVASADGAVWLVSADPTSGVIEAGMIIPLNVEARTSSRFGSNIAPGAPATEGLNGSESDALAAKRCALAAEKGA